MRKILLVVLCVLLIVTTVACGTKTENKVDIAVDTAGNIIGETAAEIVSEDTEDTLEDYENLVGEFELPFEDSLDFYLGTEDGTFANSITVKQDGSFYGSYYNLDKTLTGENHQNGTYYWNEYWGNFTDILWLDEFTFSMKMTYLATEHDNGVERLEDDSFKSITTLDMTGVTKDAEYILFMPNTPIHMLPENFSELINKDLSNQDSLDMYALYDTENQIVFCCEL